MKLQKDFKLKNLFPRALLGSWTCQGYQFRGTAARIWEIAAARGKIQPYAANPGNMAKWEDCHSPSLDL